MSLPPLPPMLPASVADAHLHIDMGTGKSHNALDLNSDRAEIESLVAAAASVNVTKLINVGCEIPGARFAIEFANQFPNVYAAVALHPNEAPRLVREEGEAAYQAALMEISQLATDARCFAVGETGLDFFRTTEPNELKVQEDSFRFHINLAKELNKTLMIHDRDSHDSILKVLDSEGAPERVMMHCFSGDAEFARECIDRGFYLSFAGTVTFKNAAKLREALLVVPQDRLLVETDAPFLTPDPYRGMPNASYMIGYTMRFIADHRGEDLRELCEAVMTNTHNAFNLVP
ncbi:MAG: TatD family hydrolase [Candidatus Nanopelagicales bacterium]